MPLSATVFSVLAGLSLLSLLIGRPWTTIVARRRAPRDVWGHPLFKETNTVLTLLWALIFAATGFCAWATDEGLLFVAMALGNTGLGMASPWIGKCYAAWRAPSYGAE